MVEFMLIKGGGAQSDHAGGDGSDPERIVLQLRACLAVLDRIGAGIAAAHVDTAIQHLRRQFDLDVNTSGSD